MTNIRVEGFDVLYALPFTAHKTESVLIKCGKHALTNWRILEYQIQDPLWGFSKTPDKRQNFNEDRASISVNRTIWLEQGGLKHFSRYLRWELFQFQELPCPCVLKTRRAQSFYHCAKHYSAVLLANYIALHCFVFLSSLRVHSKKISTAKEKYSTDVSAASACFSISGLPHMKQSDKSDVYQPLQNMSNIVDFPDH